MNQQLEYQQIIYYVVVSGNNNHASVILQQNYVTASTYRMVCWPHGHCQSQCYTNTSRQGTQKPLVHNKVACTHVGPIERIII